MIPAAAGHPFARFEISQPGADALLKFWKRSHAFQIYFEHLLPGARQMDMRIIESRHGELPTQIEDARFRPSLKSQICIRCGDCHNGFSTNRNSASPGILRITGIDMPIEEDEIGG